MGRAPRSRGKNPQTHPAKTNPTILRFHARVCQVERAPAEAARRGETPQVGPNPSHSQQNNLQKPRPGARQDRIRYRGGGAAHGSRSATVPPNAPGCFVHATHVSIEAHEITAHSRTTKKNSEEKRRTGSTGVQPRVGFGFRRSAAAGGCSSGHVAAAGCVPLCQRQPL